MDLNAIFTKIREELQKNNHEKAQKLLNSMREMVNNLERENHIQLTLLEAEILSQRYEIDEAFKKIIQAQVRLIQEQKMTTFHYLESLFLLLDVLDKRGLMDAMRCWHFQAEEILTSIMDHALEKTLTCLAKIYLSKAVLEMHKGQLSEALSDLNQTIHLATLLGDNFIKAKALVLCGIIKRDTDELNDALVFFEQAKYLARQIGNVALFTSCMINIGTVHDLKGNLDKALEVYFEIQPQAEKINDPHILGILYNDIGIIYRLKAKPNEALRYQQLCIQQFEFTRNPRLLGLAYHNLAITFWDLKKFTESAFYEQQSLKYKRMIGNPSEIAVSLSTLGIIHGIQGELETALHYFFKALNEIKHVKGHTYLPTILNNIGYAYYSKGELHKAITYFERAHQLEKKANNPKQVAEVLLNIGLCHLRLGNHWEAQKHLEKAKKIFLSAKHQVNAADPSFNLLILALDRMDLEKAKKELTFLNQVKNEFPKNEYLKQLHRVSKAALLKNIALRHLEPNTLETLGFIFNKLAVAEKLLRHVLYGPLTDYELKVFANLHLSEILLLKAQIFEDASYIIETNQLIEDIYHLAIEQHSHILKVQALWLKGKISLVQGKGKEAERTLLKALEITKTHQLGQLKALLSEELQLVRALMSKLEDSKELPFSVRLSISRITETLWCLQGRRLSCEKPMTAPISFDQATRFLAMLQHRFDSTTK